MRVDVKNACPDLIGPLRSGVYDVPENITISELLGICGSECDVEIRENAESSLLFLLNGKSAQPDAKLSGGDKIHVLRQVYGG